MSFSHLVFLVRAAFLIGAVHCFVLTTPSPPSSSSSSSLSPPVISKPSTFFLHLSSSPSKSTSTSDTLIQLTLEKPLGLVLEEVQEGEAQGVYVMEVSDEGSAAGNNQLVGLILATVNGRDVSAMDFDAVMASLVDAPSPVSLEFVMPNKNKEENYSTAISLFDVGTTVTIKVLEDDGSETIVEAKVGDNLRKILLDNNVQVYKGLKQTLGNCGGAGQGTFCAAEFIESEGWSERSEYEDQKLKKRPNARLSCLNNIQGPATIRL
jgi:ferredoxin